MLLTELLLLGSGHILPTPFHLPFSLAPFHHSCGTLALLFFMFLPYFSILEFLVAHQFLKHNSKKEQTKTKTKYSLLQWSLCSPGKLCHCLTRASLCPNDTFYSGCVLFLHILLHRNFGLHIICCPFLTAIQFYFKSLNFSAQSSVQ